MLIRNNEWDYAREFISVSSVLDDERREAFLQALQSLQDDQQETERQEREEQHRQEDKLRRDVEEARRLRAENEEREKRRLQEERARREGSEIDYGVDARSVGASSSAKSARRNRTQTNGSTAAGRPARPAAADPKGTSSNKNKAVAPASFGARAAAMFANVRAMLERMRLAMQNNPMLLMRFLAFILGLVLMFSKKNMRERLMRILATSWNKVRATAGMGVKVSYI